MEIKSDEGRRSISEIQIEGYKETWKCPRCVRFSVNAPVEWLSFHSAFRHFSEDCPYILPQCSSDCTFQTRSAGDMLEHMKWCGIDKMASAFVEGSDVKKIVCGPFTLDEILIPFECMSKPITKFGKDKLFSVSIQINQETLGIVMSLTYNDKKMRSFRVWAHIVGQDSSGSFSNKGDTPKSNKNDKHFKRICVPPMACILSKTQGFTSNPSLCPEQSLPATFSVVVSYFALSSRVHSNRRPSSVDIAIDKLHEMFHRSPQPSPTKSRPPDGLHAPLILSPSSSYVDLGV